MPDAGGADEISVVAEGGEGELAELKELAVSGDRLSSAYLENQKAIESRRTSSLIHNPVVKKRVATITDADAKRQSAFALRKNKQQRGFSPFKRKRFDKTSATGLKSVQT